MTGAPAEWSMVAADAWEAVRARVAVRSFLAMQADQESDLDAVETIIGELVANVIRHAAGPIGIHVCWRGEGAFVIVADRGPGIPVLRPCPDGNATSGRGLFLVEALAQRVEVDTVPGAGSRVVVQLPVRRRPRVRKSR